MKDYLDPDFVLLKEKYIDKDLNKLKEIYNKTANWVKSQSKEKQDLRLKAWHAITLNSLTQQINEFTELVEYLITNSTPDNIEQLGLDFIVKNNFTFIYDFWVLALKDKTIELLKAKIEDLKQEYEEILEDFDK